MGNGSLKSEFRFLSYKIDEEKLWILRDIGVLQFDCNYEKHEWKLDVNIRQPIYFKTEKIYVCGLDAVLQLTGKKEKGKKKRKWLRLKIGIAGLFAIDEQIGGDLERKFVTISAPAILFPYLRAAATNILASSGFGSVILPLINMYKIGESYSLKEDFKINVKD